MQTESPMIQFESQNVVRLGSLVIQIESPVCATAAYILAELLNA